MVYSGKTFTDYFSDVTLFEMYNPVIRNEKKKKYEKIQV